MISLLYSTVGFVIGISYLPQVIRLIRSRTRCMEISLSSWMIWNYTATVSLLYSVYVLDDLKLSIVNAICVFFNNLVIAITLYKRKKYKQTAPTMPESEKPL